MEPHGQGRQPHELRLLRDPHHCDADAHAYADLNLKLSSGPYGSTFFLLTGFHGFHVFVGMLMLLFITLRLQKGHFTSERHFGFEGAAWYWHFVDVVWLGLYVIVYWM